MAEKGAHLTTTQLAKPSIFEVIAQDSLTTTFHPASKRLVQFLISRNPEKYGWLSRWFEEVYLVFNAGLQSYYLKYKGASFAETFYGLQRLSLKTGRAPGQLTQRERLLSLILLTFFPYFRNRLEALSLKYRLEEADGIVVEEQWRRIARHVLINAHRVFHLSYELWTFSQYLRYMSGMVTSHSPLLALARVTLCYAQEDENEYSWTQLWNAIASGSFKFSIPSMRAVGSAWTRGLELVAFFVQFLQWWHSEQTRADITALPVPEPPLVGEIAHQYGGVCPICTKPWKIETLLSVSGYVFCYRCIRSHLTTSATCPVTRYPATEEDLIRIYPAQS